MTAPEWRSAPDVREHHRSHADGDGLSWWAVRSPRSPLIATDATGYVCARSHECAVMSLAAGDGTPTIAGADVRALWGEWAPVDGWYGATVPWPEARPVSAPELSSIGGTP